MHRIAFSREVPYIKLLKDVIENGVKQKVGMVLLTLR